MNKKIEDHDLEDLENVHLRMLDFIIRNAFVDNSTSNITKQIRTLLEMICQFSHIVRMVCAEDVLSEQQNQVIMKL